MFPHRARRAARAAFTLVLASLLAIGPVAVFAAPSGQSALPPHAADRFLVKFAPGATNASITALNARHGVRELDRLEHLGVRVMSVPRGKSAEALSRTYSANPNVEFAEPDFVVKASFVPNDTHYSLQWAMPKISAPAAWDTVVGSPAVKIAIVDTGIDATQPDLSGRVLAGYDYVNGDTNPADDNGHGTMCAGVAGANGNNSMGVAGTDWAARLLPVKVLNASGSGYTSHVANGITYAAYNGAKIISLSLGSRYPSTTMLNAVNYAYGRGSLLVAASGNDGSSSISYPAAYPNVIAVGATDSSDALASFSNYGAAQDVVAPGVSIATTYMGGSYVYFSGTSAATPFVAGIAGLVLARNPSLTNAGVEAAIRAGALDLGLAGWDQTFGWGRVDAAGAVAAATGGADTVTVTSASASPNPATVGQSITFTASATDSLGHAISYQWTEGATVLSSSQTFSTSLLTVGTHSITVRATCSSGQFATRTISVVVNGTGGVATTLTISGPATVPAGQTFTLSGTLTAADGSSTEGQVVTIQHLPGNNWSALGQATVTAGGTWTFSTTTSSTMYYRAVFAGSGSLLRSTSPALRVTVN